MHQKTCVQWRSAQMGCIHVESALHGMHPCFHAFLFPSIPSPSFLPTHPHLLHYHFSTTVIKSLALVTQERKDLSCLTMGADIIHPGVEGREGHRSGSGCCWQLLSCGPKREQMRGIMALRFAFLSVQDLCPWWDGLHSGCVLPTLFKLSRNTFCDTLRGVSS